MRHKNKTRGPGTSPREPRPAWMWVIVAACATTSAFGSTQPADLLVTGGQVYTPGGWREALAVRDGVIVAVGTVGEVAAYRGPQTVSYTHLTLPTSDLV